MTETTLYTRPTKTKATAVGDRNRTRWSRHLRRRLCELLPPTEFLAAEEGEIAEAIRRQRNGPHGAPWYDRPKWLTTRIRTEQTTAIRMLQKRHLKTTGKEISRAEVLAALMAAGLETIINHADFGGSTADGPSA